MILADRYPLPREAWYVAASSAELGETPLAAQVFDDRLALLRGEDGAPFALQDRCPHRGVALSLGRAEGGQVACAYHGWRFGADGACAHIPSLPGDGPIGPGIGVRAYPCIEQDGQIWVWMGDGGPKPLRPLPIAGFAVRAWMQGALDLACEAMLPIENNLDLCHPYFTHPGLHPQYFAIQRMGFRRLRYELRPEARGLAVHEEGRDAALLRFDLPDRVTVAVGPMVIVLHHTPMGPGRCRQHWLLSAAPSAPGQPHGVQWTDVEPEIFAQDRRVMESAQRAYAEEGDAFERSVVADAPTLAARRLVRPVSSLSAKAPELKRRVITVRG